MWKEKGTARRLTLGLAIAPLAVAVIAVMGAWTLSSCSGDDSEPESRIVVRNPQRVHHPPAPVTPAIPVRDTTRATIEPAAAPAEESVGPPKLVTYEEAETAFLERRYEAATELFTRYTEQKPQNPWGFYMRGLSAWKAGENEMAVTSFERALQLDPQHVKSHVNLGRVLLQVERADDALTHVAHALLIDPGYSAAYRVQGRTFHELGQNEEAVRAYRQAIQIDDQDAWSMNNLGLILIEEQRYDEALSALARAVELDGEVAVFQNNLGMVLEHAGQFRMAEEAYRRATELDGSYDHAALNLGRVELVREVSDLEPVDLSVAARRFVDDIESWRSALNPANSLDARETELAIGEVAVPADELVVEPVPEDSTGTGGE